jgi:tetratricopeptide (TPR) repeat protein
VTAGVALAVCSSLVLPWLGGRWTGAAEGALDRPARAVTLAKRARSVDPLSVEPVYAQALAEEERGHLGRTLGLLRKATRMQPQNADAWFRLGSFDLNVRNCPRAALPSLERFVELDSQGRGGEEKQRALRLVNSGKPIC